MNTECKDCRAVQEAEQNPETECDQCGWSIKDQCVCGYGCSRGNGCLYVDPPESDDDSV